MLKHVSFVTADADAVTDFYTALGASVRKDLVTGEGFRRLVLSFGGGGTLQFFELPRGANPDPASPEAASSSGTVQRVLQDQPDAPETAFSLLHPAPRPDTEHAWMEHIALHLPDLHASLEQLRTRGTTFSRKLTLSPGGTPMAFVLDPDGRQVELLQQD